MKNNWETILQEGQDMRKAGQDWQQDNNLATQGNWKFLQIMTGKRNLSRKLTFSLNLFDLKQIFKLECFCCGPKKTEYYIYSSLFLAAHGSPENCVFKQQN